MNSYFDEQKSAFAELTINISYVDLGSKYVVTNISCSHTMSIGAWRLLWTLADKSLTSGFISSFQSILLGKFACCVTALIRIRRGQTDGKTLAVDLEGQTALFIIVGLPAQIGMLCCILCQPVFERSAVLEVLGKDYIKMAKAKGVKSHALMLKHALRNALIPIITVIAQSFVSLIAGALVTETVFNIPGVGKLMIDSIGRRDYEVVQAMVLLIAVLNVLVMFLLDILYGMIDPRIRSER